MNKLTFEAEQYFQELHQNKEATQDAWLQINNTINEVLGIQNDARLNIDLFLSLIPFIESGDGKLPFKYIGETHRILRILHIVEMEYKYQMRLFCSGCNDKASLVEKYMLSLFALRRLVFHLSDDSEEDAIFYLQQNPLSVFAVYIITQDDLIHADNTLYHKIAKIYSDDWSESEYQLFLSLTQTLK